MPSSIILFLIFEDDIFLLKPKGWLEEFAEKFPNRIGLPLFVNVRPETINDKTEIEPFSRAIQDAKVKFQAHLHDKISDIMMRVDNDIERMDSYENGNPNYEIENHTLPKKYSPQMRKILNQDSTDNINYDAFLILKP